MVGALIAVGEGKLPLEDITRRLEVGASLPPGVRTVPPWACEPGVAAQVAVRSACNAPHHLERGSSVSQPNLRLPTPISMQVLAACGGATMLRPQRACNCTAWHTRYKWMTLVRGCTPSSSMTSGGGCCAPSLAQAPRPVWRRLGVAAASLVVLAAAVARLVLAVETTETACSTKNSFYSSMHKARGVLTTPPCIVFVWF